MKYLVAGGKRTGTTLLCAILANAGADFGFPRNREWFRGSGDYEHPIMVSNYKYLKRSRLTKPFSDSFARRQQLKIQKNMKHVLDQVDYIKYPPLSEYLPLHIKKAGHEVQLLVTIRRFNDFALSALAKGGDSYAQTRDIYLETYKTNLLNLHLYGGSIVTYEQIIDQEAEAWATPLSEATNIPAADLIRARNEIINPTSSKNAINLINLDPECDELYDTYVNLSDRIFLPDPKKQHKV